MKQTHPQLKDGVWDILSRGFFLLDQTYLIHTEIATGEGQSDLDSALNFALFLPLDLNILTFGLDCSSQENALARTLAGDLYYMLWIADNSSEGTIAQSNYDYVFAQWIELHHKLVINDTNSEIPEQVEDVRALPLRLSTLILASYLLGPEICQDLRISDLTSRLQQVLKTTGFGLEAHLAWAPFPGALICCHAVGMRLSEKGSRVWFTMQFMKLSHPWLIERWEDAFKTVASVSKAVRNIRPVRVGQV